MSVRLQFNVCMGIKLDDPQKDLTKLIGVKKKDWVHYIETNFEKYHLHLTFISPMTDSSCVLGFLLLSVDEEDVYNLEAHEFLNQCSYDEYLKEVKKLKKNLTKLGITIKSDKQISLYSFVTSI